jgi:chromosome segregation ATPase
MTRERKKISDLKKKIQALEAKIDKLETDRAQFRDHFKVRYDWWWKLLKENSEPDLKWLCHNDSLWLRKFEYWMW